jgi:hypothetical protein
MLQLKIIHFSFGPPLLYLCSMSFERIKTITKNGRTYSYRYRQTSVREGKKVHSKMEYLGPAGGGSFGGLSDRQDRALATAERMAKEMDVYQRGTFGETGEERAARDAKESQFDQGKFLEETQMPDAKENPQEGD